MSVSVKPRLADRQPSNRGGVPRVKTWREARAERKRGRPHCVSRTVTDGAHHRRR